MITKTQLLDVAVGLAEKTPLYMVTRRKIAKKAGVAPSLVSYYLGTMDELRADIVTLAIMKENVQALASAMRANHIGVSKAPKQLKAAAAKLLSA